MFLTFYSLSLSGKGCTLLPDGARQAASSGTNDTQPNHAEDDADTRGAHDQPSVPRPEPEAHRRPSPVHLLAGAVSLFFLIVCCWDLLFNQAISFKHLLL